MDKIKRYWINQPSIKQKFHHLHSANVLGYKEDRGITRIYFLTGGVVSMNIPDIVLEKLRAQRLQVQPAAVGYYEYSASRWSSSARVRLQLGCATARDAAV